MTSEIAKKNAMQKLEQNALIRANVLQMQVFIADGKFDKARELARKQPNVGKALYLRLKTQIKSTNAPDPEGRYLQIMEAMLGMKEGGLAETASQKVLTIKRNIPEDMKHRFRKEYRVAMGGAWMLWKLGEPWNMQFWSRGWVCPPVGQAPSEPPVPELAFGPKGKHELVRCEFHGLPRDYQPKVT